MYCALPVRVEEESIKVATTPAYYCKVLVLYECEREAMAVGTWIVLASMAASGLEANWTDDHRVSKHVAQCISTMKH
jgi:hypothetical protein